MLKWLATHPCDKKGPRFSVNLMPLTLLQKNIAGRIIRLFKRYHISPQAVILEITEEQAFSNAESSMYNIEQLHKFGFRIAIDDFGTGYANYERLKRLQADIIKIDGVFVKDIVTEYAGCDDCEINYRSGESEVIECGRGVCRDATATGAIA